MQLPHAVVDGMESEDNSSEIVSDDDGVWITWIHEPMASGEVWDLSFDYWLADAVEEGEENVQLGGAVCCGTSWKRLWSGS